MRVWWNGRHGGLKILWWLHRAGSSPATRTIRGIRKIKNVERSYGPGEVATNKTGSGRQQADAD